MLVVAAFHSLEKEGVHNLVVEGDDIVAVLVQHTRALVAPVVVGIHS